MPWRAKQFLHGRVAEVPRVQAQPVSQADGALIESFLDMMSAERGASANTLAAYRRDLTDFSASCAGGQSNLKRASRENIRRYLSELSGAALKPSSQARKLSALRGFYGFLYSEGVRGDDPCGAIESPKAERPLPKILSAEEVLLLIETARAIKTEKGQETPEQSRLVCLVEMLYSSGLRIGELVSLPLSSLRKGERFIHVRGKGGRERLAPLGGEARAALDTYLAVRAELIPAGGVKGPASRYLFPSRGRSGHLTRRRCHQLLKELASKAGIDPARLSPHVLRHAFATHLVEGGADLRSIQSMLGHADIGTTQIYTHIAQRRLRKTMEGAHPLARNRVIAKGDD